eukprot:Awhi_evm1s14929
MTCNKIPESATTDKINPLESADGKKASSSSLSSRSMTRYVMRNGVLVEESYKDTSR